MKLYEWFELFTSIYVSYIIRCRIKEKSADLNMRNVLRIFYLYNVQHWLFYLGRLRIPENRFYSHNKEDQSIESVNNHIYIKWTCYFHFVLGNKMNTECIKLHTHFAYSIYILIRHKYRCILSKMNCLKQWAHRPNQQLFLS